ncbi:MAG: discoidin domain-containing protein [Balneolales bacterium]
MKTKGDNKNISSERGRFRLSAASFSDSRAVGSLSLITVLVFLLLSSSLYAKSTVRDSVEISRAFEFRYISSDPTADGETDFKGETEVFDTGQRVEYLKEMAHYSQSFYDDYELNNVIVRDEDVQSALDQLKPQPLPQVRQKIKLDNWKYLGYRKGQYHEESQRLKKWADMEGVTIKEENLLLSDNTFRVTFEEQPWRLNFSWKASVPNKKERVSFRLSEYVEVGFGENGRFFYKVDGVEIPAGSYTPGVFYNFEIELDPDGGLTPDFTRTDVSASSEIEVDSETYSHFKQHHPAAYATHGWNYWTADENLYPQWISFELEDQRDLNEIKLAFLREDDRTYDYRIEVSNDKKQWVAITEEKTSPLSRWASVKFDEPVEARYVRVVFTGASSPELPAALSRAYFFDKNGHILLADDMPLRGKFNFSVDGQLLADYVPLSRKIPHGQLAATSIFEIETEGAVILDDIHGIGYDQVTGRGVREFPFEIETFLDTDFNLRPEPEGFQHPDYDDSRWSIMPYNRYAHGGERYKEEALYLRKMIKIDDFERAVLNVETVRPSADIYVNGTLVREVGRHPERIDITDLLNPNQENLLAVRVDPFRVDEVLNHMSSDPWTGWFAGLMDIELTSKAYIGDIFAYAKDVGKTATLRLEAQLESESEESFNGRVITRVYPWYPQESSLLAGESSKKVEIKAGSGDYLTDEITIANPELWTVDTPNLYKVHVILEDDAGNEVDDYVLTTGLRTVSQKGGTFRVNDRPEMLNGPLLFGHHSPLMRISQWMFSPPEDRWIHDILLTKKMNGTAIRMSVHDQRVAGVNDRRLAQIGDQMGIMFLWQTPSWVRMGSVDNFDYEGLPKYVKEVRNHPSIVMWQVGNHPHGWSMDWFQKVYDTVSEVDQTRLISPAADISQMPEVFENTIGSTGRPADTDKSWSSWSSPLIARGTMERILGYGQEWHNLRYIPGMHEFLGLEKEVRMEYLNSKTHAWFDFESEETISQANWNTTRGKPYHKMYSYEINYDVGSIGRKLDFEEWRESQAWQALSAYEAYRKKRWLGFDGLFWCPLRGGGNTATYMKPLLGFDNHPKLAYYALQMAFQPVLAGSKNVDIVYGPNDEIPVMVMNLGEGRTVDVIIHARNMDGSIVDEIIYREVDLPDGKGVVNLGNWKPDLQDNHYYGFEYIVRSNDKN